ncbi:MAG: hypothetical protein JSU68_09835 [Phycisphaerales bacterium]|nr:MAG: hypothetical protein JSU68_09835 [Phycisphaerales bacterium]
MFRVRYSLVCLVLTALWSVSSPLLADELHVRLHPESTGPFPPGVGGQIPYFVSVEIVDAEADGYDSQGLWGVSWDLYTDTGIAAPVSQAAFTGETGLYGPAIVQMPRYVDRYGPEVGFVGGYGFEADFALFVGLPDGDDLLDVGGVLPLWWTADVDSDSPGLQPQALAGMGIGQRPAGGAWLLAEGLFNYPVTPGIYSVELLPGFANVIRPDVDLSQDQGMNWYEAFAPEDIYGDSFTFAVLPEPASLILLAAGLVLLRRR